VNPVILLIAGRRLMPVVGILHHRGRRSGRDYATPIGMRPLGDSFVIPRTFSENAAWYLNVKAAGWCVVTYLGSNHVLIEPEVVDFAMAGPAFPRYELWQFRLIGINEYLRLRRAPNRASHTDHRRTAVRRCRTVLALAHDRSHNLCIRCPGASGIPGNWRRPGFPATEPDCRFGRPPR
jgi:deazaflavin-dependent oxidoreductase (nitroreductase family)